MIPGLAEWLSPGDPAVRADRNVHPEVQRRRTLRRPQIKLPQSGPQVVGAIVMVPCAAERGLAVHIASRNNRVMAAR